MSVAGTCEVCQTGGVEHTCTRCGQLVCEDHFEADTGLCVECVAEVGGDERPGRQVPPENAPDGVDTYRF